MTNHSREIPRRRRAVAHRIALRTATGACRLCFETERRRKRPRDTNAAVIQSRGVQRYITFRDPLSGAPASTFLESSLGSSFDGSRTGRASGEGGMPGEGKKDLGPRVGPSKHRHRQAPYMCDGPRCPPTGSCSTAARSSPDIKEKDAEPEKNISAEWKAQVRVRLSRPGNEGG